MNQLQHFFIGPFYGIRHRGLPALFAAVLMISVFGVTSSGCKSPIYSKVELPPPPPVSSGTNVLQEGDFVSITFQYSTNFNATQKIPLDGLLNLESIGPVKASGKTPQ